MANQVTVKTRGGDSLFDLPISYRPVPGEKLTYDGKVYVVTADPPETEVRRTPLGTQVFMTFIADEQKVEKPAKPVSKPEKAVTRRGVVKEN